MRIQIYGSTYITEQVVKLLKQHYKLVGYVPSVKPDFPGKIDLPEGVFPHDIKLSIQYDKKLEDTKNAYNLHTGILPDYGGCNILYHVLKNGEKEYGITFHKMAEEYDSGEILAKISVPIMSKDKEIDLYKRLARIAPAFALACLRLIPITGEKKTPTVYKRSDINPEASQKNREDISQFINTRACKVICTCFAKREINSSNRYPCHTQHIDSAEQSFVMIKKVIEAELVSDGGYPFDLIIVNNQTGHTEGDEWLDSLNGQKTKNGKVIVMHRENKGGSFGAYNYAFEQTDYDEYLFTEDDIIIFGQDYYKLIRDKYYEMEAGFVGMIGVDYKTRWGVHAHGGSGFTTRPILAQVYKEWGELPNSGEYWNKDDVIREGEIKFTNAIHKESQKVIPYGDNLGWDKKNLCLPYELWEILPS